MSIAGLTPIEAAIVGSAETYGVDPRLALSIAQYESGLNPAAVGDGGTSYGLYQLHQGGELGSLTPAQAFNPVTNADTALAVVSRVAAADPNGDPGSIAAAAQRPADPSAYAAAVDAIYSDASYFPQVPAAMNATLTSSSGGSALGQAAVGALNVVPGLGTAAAAAGGLGGGLLSGLTGSWLKVLLDIAFVVAAFGLVLLGMSRLFPGVSRTVTSTLPLAAAA